MSCICSGVRDATSAASTSGAMTNGAAAGGAPNSGAVDGNTTGAAAGAWACTTGGVGGVGGGASFPLFKTQMPTR